MTNVSVPDNAGPARFEAYRDHGRPLPNETVRFIATVLLKDEMQSAVAPHSSGEDRGRILFSDGRVPHPPDPAASWRRLFVSPGPPIASRGQDFLIVRPGAARSAD